MLTDWIELCKLFSAHGVEFLLVGGQAVIAHGYPRLTRDMDLWVRPSAENGEKVPRHYRNLALPRRIFQAQRFEDPATMLMLGIGSTSSPTFPG